MLHGPCLADDRRAPLLTPGPVAQLPGADPGDARGGHRGPALGLHLAGVAEPFGHREHRRQRDLDLLHAVVVLELEAQERAAVFEPAHPAREGEVEQRRHLGPDLTRLAVDGVAAEQDEVEGAGDAQRGRQGPRRGERVGSGEHRVGHVQPGGGTPGHPLAQDVLRTGGPERHDRARAARGLRQRDPLGHGAAAVRVHLEVDVVADQSPLLEAERLGQRDLLDERRDPQRPPLGSRHRTALTSPRRQRRARAPRPGPGWPGCRRSARRGSTTPPRPPGSWRWRSRRRRAGRPRTAPR